MKTSESESVIFMFSKRNLKLLKSQISRNKRRWRSSWLGAFVQIPSKRNSRFFITRQSGNFSSADKCLRLMSGTVSPDGDHLFPLWESHSVKSHQADGARKRFYNKSSIFQWTVPSRLFPNLQWYVRPSPIVAWTSFILDGWKKCSDRKSGINFLDFQPSKLKPFLNKSSKISFIPSFNSLTAFSLAEI